jgi:hypothetical protein
LISNAVKLFIGIAEICAKAFGISTEKAICPMKEAEKMREKLSALDKKEIRHDFCPNILL